MEKVYFIFSYWIFLWYLLYYCKIIKYNPKFAIIIGMIENICILLLMIYYNTKIKLFLLFILMMIILKFIPLYSIWNTKIQTSDIIATFVLFIIYLFFMILNKKNISDFIKQSKDLIIYNKNTLPGMSFFEKIGIL
jgi:hypothetical protein